MNKLSYGNFDITNADIAFDSTSGYTEPASELERRKQLSYPLKEIKTFVNNTVAEDASGNAIQLKIDNGVLKYRSTVGGSLSDVYSRYIGSGDLNDIDYYFAGYVSGSVNNTPRSGYGGTLTASFDNSTDYGSQIFVETYTNHVYTRAKYSGSWFSWRRLDGAFNAGDTLSLNNGMYSGYINSTGTDLRFFIPAQRYINASTFTFTSCKLYVIGPDSAFASGTELVGTTGYTFTTTVNSSGIFVKIVKSNKWANGTCCCCAYIDSGSGTFA